MINLWSWLWAEETGQGLTEYALILTLVAMVIIASMVMYRDKLNTTYNQITSQFRY